MNWIINTYRKTNEILKIFVYKTIVSFTQKMNLLKDKFVIENLYPNPNNYEDLTPTNDSENNGDKVRVYSNTLKWALENKKILNIALTGSFGSGKSSILRTFEKEHCEYQYLNISLASFKEDEVNERLIELSILQQIFYHVKVNNIPDSRFKRIKSIRFINILSKSLGLVLWLISVTVFLKFKIFQDTVVYKSISEYIDLISYFSFGIIILGAIIIISKTIRILNNSKLNKLNIQSGEIELNKDIDQSILNKHIDEILYFFEVTKFKVVIIEDLDRFKDTEIFTKLRELNLLINRSKQINRRVIFIYAIKDDKFKDENRTKFFDFIIPVISVINPSNSGAILLDKFKKAEFENTVSSEFIEDVSLYIDDMRLLKNIFNEYVIYKNKLDKKLNPNCLLAIIIYKNFYPSDFAELQNNKGKIFNVFLNKTEVIKKQIELINEQIKSANLEIKDIESERLKDIEELRSLYILKFIEKFPRAESIIINGSTYNFQSLKANNEFSLLITQENIQYTGFSPNHGRIMPLNSSTSFSSIEKEFNANLSYKKREELIDSKVNNKNEILKRKIEDLTKDKEEIKEMTLENLAEKVDIGNVFKEFDKDRLIVYLLRNGYINENYHDYISFFYEGFITKEDRDYLFSIKNRSALEFNHKLFKVESIIGRIRLNEWKNKEVLNFSLVDFLLTRQDTYKNQLKSIEILLEDESDISFQFIDKYIENGVYISDFVKWVGNFWYGLWAYIVTKSNLSSIKKDNYLKLIIENLRPFDISNLNSHNQLSEYISEKQDFIQVFSNEQYIEKIKSTIVDLKIQFNDLAYSGESNWLSDFIYENNHYQLSSKMIILFLNLKLNDKDLLVNIDKANYSTIKSTKCTHLIKYIDANINTYVTEVLLKLENNSQETQETIISLVNNEKITPENIYKIIEEWDNSISDISKINNLDYIENIIIWSKMDANWNNVIYYYKSKEEKFDESLIEYLNEDINFKSLSKNKLNTNKSETEEFVQKISKDLILCDDISDEGFSYLMKSIPYIYNSLDFENLSVNKVNWMVDNRFLTLTTDNYLKLKEKFPNKHINLIENNPIKFIEEHEKFLIEKSDLYKLLGSGKFSFTQKFILIKSKEILIINEEELSSITCTIMSNIEQISPNYDFLKSIIKFGESTNEKLKVITNHISILNENQITELIIILDSEFSNIGKRGKKPKIDENNINTLFVEKLKQKNYISSYNIEKGKIKINTRRKIG